jgi:hypothetical protein
LLRRCLLNPGQLSDRWTPAGSSRALPAQQHVGRQRRTTVVEASQRLCLKLTASSRARRRRAAAHPGKRTSLQRLGAATGTTEHEGGAADPCAICSDVMRQPVMAPLPVWACACCGRARCGARLPVVPAGAYSLQRQCIAPCPAAGMCPLGAFASASWRAAASPRQLALAQRRVSTRSHARCCDLRLWAPALRRLHSWQAQLTQVRSLAAVPLETAS